MIELSYILIGLIAGLMAGLLGVGGGLITVPSLVFIFHLQGDYSPQVMQKAIATSLSAMIWTATASAISHYFKQLFALETFKHLSPGLVIGSIIGALIASHLPGAWLKTLFGTSLVTIGFYLMFFKKQLITSQPQLPFFHSYLMRMYSFLIGLISALLGIGGGIMTTPLLVFYGLPIRQAVSTSALLGLLIAITGTLTFLILALVDPAKSSLINLQACFLIGVSSSLIAPYGAKLSTVIHPSILKALFSCFLICTGIFMSIC